MSGPRNLAFALLIHRSRWLVVSDSVCSTLAILSATTCVILCILWSPIDSPEKRYRACSVFEVSLSTKAPIRVHPCSHNRSWPLPLISVHAALEPTGIHLPAKWSMLHFLGTTFPTRMAGWHYVVLANISSLKCSHPYKTVRPPFRGYTFRPSSALPFL